MPAPVVDKRLLLAVAAGSILLSPILFAYELVMSIVLVGFGIAFHSLRPVAAARLVTIGAGLAAGPLAYVLLAVVIAVF